MFSILGAIAEFETALRAERQAEGIAKAQANGVKFGRKDKLTPAQVQDLRQDRAAGVQIKDLMNGYGLSKSSVYRLLKG